MLHYGQLGDPEHCFALRSQITEGDAARLIKNSKAFTNPISIPRKKVYRQPSYLKIATALLVATAMVAATLAYAFSRNNHADAAPVAVPVQAAPVVSTTGGCYLLYKHQISGPFPLKAVADMNAAGVLNADTLCRLENSTDWIKPADLTASRSPK